MILFIENDAYSLLKYYISDHQFDYQFVSISVHSFQSLPSFLPSFLLSLSLSLSFYLYLYMCVCVCLSYIQTPPLGQDMTQDQFFKRSLTGLNSEFFLLLD